ncbi:MAG: spore cortex biosynthesis protein YabQ [Bacillota bacterium]|nr:spore cortex biosynthesis protein YabQ [Bacillota bacterium]
MEGLLFQVESFLLTFLLGILAGCMFHFYQLFLRNLKLRRISLYFLDFFWWIAMVCVISVGILLINQGEVRIYVFIALVLGVITYFRWGSSYTSQMLQKVAFSTVWLLQKGYRVTIFALRKIKQGGSKLIHRPPPEPPPPSDLDA